MTPRLRHCMARLALGCTLLFAPPTSARADAVFRVEPEIRGVEPGSGVVATEAALTAASTVRLSVSSVLVVGDDSSQWLDFESGQCCLREEGGDLYSYSVTSLVAFREMEIRNREMVAEQVEGRGEAATGAVAARVAADETELCMRAPRLGRPLSRGESDEQVYFGHGEKVWSAYSKERIDVLDPDAPELLATYLRFARGGHPDMLDEIARLEYVPRWVSFRTNRLGSAEICLHLSVVANFDPPPPPDCTNVPPGDLGTMATLLSSARALDEKDSRTRAAAIEIEATAAFESGNTFAGALCFLEASLMRPMDEVRWADPWNAAVSSDPTFQELMLFFRPPSSDEDARQMVEGIRGMAARMGSRSYLADTWCAGLLYQLGEVAAARSSILAALSANPLLTQAWVDLGDSYWAEWDPFSAAGCFAVAGTIAPDHASVARFIEYEGSLRERYPEYFHSVNR